MQENNPKIFVVIVFFHPSDEQVENARRIGRCYHTVVVDNSPEAIYSLGDEGLTYIPLLENKGIAFAQNRGIEYALSQGAEYIVTFDQDSKPQEDFVPCLMQQFVSIKKGTDNLMVVGPMIIDETTGVAYKHNLGDRDEQKVTTVISSGMLASKEAFAEAGLFEEKMFIDLVDHEWCFRLASVGGGNLYDEESTIAAQGGRLYSSAVGNTNAFRHTFPLLLQSEEHPLATSKELSSKGVESKVCHTAYGNYGVLLHYCAL